MAPVLRPVRQLAHQTNTVVMLTHHQNKAGSFRGSTAIRAAFDLEWSFARTDGDTESVDETVRARMQVEGRHGPRTTVHMRLGEGLRWHPEQPVAPTPKVGTRDKILNHLGTADTFCTAMEIAQGIAVAERTAENELAKMTRESPCPLVIQGTGTKNDPRRYSVVSRTDGDGLQRAFWPMIPPASSV
jgi:hypothetical protein